VLLLKIALGKGTTDVNDWEKKPEKPRAKILLLHSFAWKERGESGTTRRGKGRKTIGAGPRIALGIRCWGGPSQSSRHVLIGDCLFSAREGEKGGEYSPRVATLRRGKEKVRKQ